jgi:hypothetical protein
MTSLIERLYPLPDYRRTPLSLLRWWESRRLLYNKIVGATGVATLGGLWTLSALPPISEPLPLSFAMGGALVYGLMANLCYTMGWGVEIVARLLWGRDAPDMGPVLFRQGLIFSVGLTVLPLFVMTIAWIVQVVLAVVL